MSVDERGPKIAGPTGQTRVGGWEKRVDDVEVEVELGSVQVEGCQLLLVCCVWVGLAEQSKRGRGREGQRLAAEVG